MNSLEGSDQQVNMLTGGPDEAEEKNILKCDILCVIASLTCGAVKAKK